MPHRPRVREVSYIIAIVAGLVLLVAMGAWVRIAEKPKNDLIQDEGGKPVSQRATWASRLIAVAFGLSGLAACIAVIAWISGS
jgi:hypothetical protein